MHFLEWKCIFVPGGPNSNFLALVQIMAWRRPSDKILSELMMFSLLTHICVTRRQWINIVMWPWPYLDMQWNIICNKNKWLRWLVLSINKFLFLFIFLFFLTCQCMTDVSLWCVNEDIFTKCLSTLQWRHNGHDGVSNHQPHHCLLNLLSGRGSKKTSKVRVIRLCMGNSSGTGEFPTQMVSNAENASIWWRHRERALLHTCHC